VIALLIPSHPSVEAAIDWLEARGTIIRACLLRGEDGMIRGNALVRLRS
jgi:hypothetical protein